MLSIKEYKNKLRLEGTVDWESSPDIEFLWCFEMKASREEIWTYISDTSRFNRELGFGKRQQIEKDGKVIVTTKMIGFRQEWVEQPWTWLQGQTITSTRIYLKGMAKKVQSVFHIDDDTAQNKRRVYLYFGWQPKNSFWKFFLKSTASVLQKNFAKAFAKLDHHLENQNGQSRTSEKAFRISPPQLSDAALSSVNEVKLQLEKRKLNQRSIDLLTELVRSGDDLDLEPIKILPLARTWKIPEQELLATSLHATRLGLLKMSWDLICPHCRGSRYSAESLGAIPELSICEVCDLEFSASEPNSVEVMFHIHPSIRKVEALMFCAAEPAKKNHIKVQQLVASKAKLELTLRLSPGFYRARLTGQNSEVNIEVADSFPQSELFLGKMKGESHKIGTQVKLHFENETETPHLFVLENLWWESSALKPAHVLALPEFRDLFSEEHLNSNVKLFLGEQTILFTDIVGSTKFYNNVGDAKAFAEVRGHFQEVFSKVQAHKGIVVKTIGDAVMAAFQSPIEAIHSAIEIQKAFHDDRKDTSIRLRISIHYGPVIAVHLNTGIDYFGNTVNLAAKIQAVAKACEVAMSPEMYNIFQKNFQNQFEFDIRQNQRDGGVPGNIYVLKAPGAEQKVA